MRTTPERLNNHVDDAQQPPLIPMSEDELRMASQHLANLVRDLERMKAEHAEEKRQMRDDEKVLEKEISSTAQSIRQQGR